MNSQWYSEEFDYLQSRPLDEDDRGITSLLTAPQFWAECYGPSLASIANHRLQEGSKLSAIIDGIFSGTSLSQQAREAAESLGINPDEIQIAFREGRELSA